MTRRRTIALWTAATVAWTAVAFVGMAALMRSAFTPDAPADAQAVWPVDLDLPRTRNEAAYIVCLHPRCPCSEATADALIEVLGTATNADAYALFAVPDNAGPDWTDTDLVTRLRHVKGLHIVLDRGGRRSALLGAKASGQAYVYDPAGRLVFAGGLTPGRGERGESVGLSVFRASVSGHANNAAADRAPVFGCALIRPSKTKAGS